MKDLSGKVAIITGARGNLGTATTHVFQEAGMKLALLDHNGERLREHFGDLATTPDVYMGPSVDLAEWSEVEAVFDEISAKFPRIDVLVNIAGGYRGGEFVHDTSDETLEFLIDLNVRTAFNMSKAVIPAMMEQGFGSIINIAARAGLKGSSKMGAYSASKSALIRLSESMSAELKKEGIRVNCVLPGTIDTPNNRKDFPNADFSRWVAPEAIAEVILFLASHRSRAITGASIPVYGKG